MSFETKVRANSTLLMGMGMQVTGKESASYKVGAMRLSALLSRLMTHAEVCMFDKSE